MTDPILFWTQIAAVGQAVGAFATTAAVIVSLWIASSDRRAHIRVEAGLRLVIPGDGTDATDIIKIEITNWGSRSVQVQSIGWRTGYFRYGPSWARTQYALQRSTGEEYSNDPPFDLAPGQSKAFLVSPAVYLSPTIDELRRDFFNRSIPFLNSPRPTKICAMVSMNAAKPAISKVEKSLHHLLATGAIVSGAAAFNEKTRDTQCPG